GNTGASSRRFSAGQSIEMKDHSRWIRGKVRQVDGDLYLIVQDARKDQFWWQWVDIDRLREPGSNYEGPDVFDQFDTRPLRNEHPLKALAGIKKEYETYVRK